ncbi:efflux RND transporter periplasmic adaptor subunit [Bradyrhizobium genosp. A]|uniref:efflux RND transporter periplasmic adaptor subunit n=1 Tax=Bradyrhizobium genosp. A TaxID=83626 RepID=UPI003CEFA7E2
MQTAVRVLLSLIVVISACFLAFDMAEYYLYSPWTRDARVRAEIITVAPDVSGYVADVRVRNDQFVKRGDLLFVIDPERYRLALADAEATVAARSAQHQMLLHQYERRSKLTPMLTITTEDLENSKRSAEQAVASYQQSVASRDLAALNLKRTEVRAAVNGFVTNLNLQAGDYATQGKAALALVDSDSYRVDAYFEETKIPQITAGSIANIHLMGGSSMLRGRVESVARGITDQDNRDGPELLATVNPTFTWVRLAQRIPVRIRLTDVSPNVLISAGMTCTVTLEKAEKPDIGKSARRLLSSLLPLASN